MFNFSHNKDFFFLYSDRICPELACACCLLPYHHISLWRGNVLLLLCNSKTVIKVPLSLLFSALNKPNSFNLSSYVKFSSPNHLSRPPWDPLQFFNVSLGLWSLKLVWPNKCQADLSNHLPWSVHYTLADAVQDMVCQGTHCWLMSRLLTFMIPRAFLAKLHLCFSYLNLC